MSGKFMRTKKIVIPTLTLLLIASQLTGCGVTNKSGALQLLRDNGTAIEIEVAEPENSTGALELTDDGCDWLEIASLTRASDLRKSWEDTLLISGTTGNKNGVLYVDSEGNQDNNNTLLVALHNRAFTTQLSDKATSTELSEAVQSYYADTDELTTDELNLIGINAYFGLLDDEQENYATPNDTLSRVQLYSMLYKAITPATDTSNGDLSEVEAKFTEAVGTYSELNYYAAQIESKAYINTSDKSLNEKTVNGSISRGEAIYLLMNTFFSDELSNVEVTGKEFSDCNPQTDTFTKEDGTDGDDYLDSYRAQVSYNNENEYGCKDEIYKALVLANQKGLINGDKTRYDEAVTKIEAIQLIVDTLELDTSMEKFNYKNGDTITEATANASTSASTSTATDESSDYEISSEVASEIAQLESESSDPFAGQDVTVDGNFTFAGDVDPADKEQILKARDEISLSVAECDDNGDGLIDKDEAATAAFMYDDETIDFLKDIRENVVDDILNESSSSSSSSSSTQGVGKVEAWEDNTANTPQIEYGKGDYSQLPDGITVY
jgi:hypothetical protein